MGWLRKAIGPLDIVIAIGALYVFWKIDYTHVDVVDYIYMVTFGIWILLLIVRLLIYRHRAKQEGRLQ